MIDQLIERALESWDDFWPGSARPRDVRYVLQSRRRIVVFLFDACSTGERLAAVIKVSRRTEENAGLERSVRVLAEVRGQLRGPIGATVPRAILLPPLNGLSVMLAQGMPGTPMYLERLPLIGLVRHRRNWTAWRRWVLQFQEQSATTLEPISCATLDEWILANIARSLRQDERAASIIADLHAIVRELEGNPIRKGWRYGDAHHSNILLDRRMVTGVVDWEGAQPGQWPTLDWLQFAVQYLVDFYHAMAPNASRTACAEWAIDSILRSPNTPLDKLVQKQTYRFLSASGIDHKALPAFFISFLATQWPCDRGALLRHAHAAICR